MLRDGAALAVAMSNVPRLDELFDFRVQYWPSQAYVDQPAALPFPQSLPEFQRLFPDDAACLGYSSKIM